MGANKKNVGRPGGIKTVDGNKKQIRRYLSGECANFERNYQQMTPAEKTDIIIRYLNGEI